MMNLQEIQAAVTELSKEELASFSQRFDEYRSDQWDEQIEADARAGRFDAIAERAIADYEAGRFTEL